MAGPLKVEIDPIDVQGLRLRRNLFGIAGGIFHTLICFIMQYKGYFRMTLPEFFALFSSFWIIHLTFTTLILTNLNEHFRDPGMTLIQMMWAVLCLMITVYFANELRHALVMLGFLPVSFGGFRLTLRQLIIFVLYVGILYLIALILLSLTPNINFNWIPELITFSIFCFVMIGTLFITIEFVGLRSHMHKKEINLKESLQRAEEDSITDEVTGIRNRRFMLNILTRQRLMAIREKRYTFAAAMIDIDHFKNVNDEYGHLCGDILLKQFCVAIEQAIRSVDYFGRIGGEEFLVIAPFADEKQITELSNRIRDAIESTEFDEIAQGLKVTISIGAAIYNLPESEKEFMKRIDHALYLAKERGRNQVVVV